MLNDNDNDNDNGNGNDNDNENEKNMLFTSESRMVFQVLIGGQYRVVEFSEQGNTGMSSTFRTDNEDVIAAIRKHRYYLQGKIREHADPKPKEKPKVVEALEISSYSQLKSYLRKTFKDDKRATKIKTPEQVAAFAKEKGVVYRFVEA